ncbi:hypothetical protein VM1G_11494 [Cytospora mali]|uniref:Uncharacterized protein n=1 Tax=Cytospora mali TaxID=578113 RepID=A0A194VTD1_CYTMA|nr:hypothetical protein VM1G_11494 [Valsa mali]
MLNSILKNPKILWTRRIITLEVAQRGVDGSSEEAHAYHINLHPTLQASATGRNYLLDNTMSPKNLIIMKLGSSILRASGGI